MYNINDIAKQEMHGLSKCINTYIKGDITTDVYNYMVAQIINWLIAYNDYIKE